MQETERRGLDPRSGRSPGGGNGNRLQYSCLENPMDRGAWRAPVHGVAQSLTRLSRAPAESDKPSGLSDSAGDLAPSLSTTFPSLLPSLHSLPFFLPPSPYSSIHLPTYISMLLLLLLLLSRISRVQLCATP